MAEVKQDVPQNINLLHKAEQEAEGFNTKIAVWITRIVGNMWCAYVFALLAIIGLFALLGILTPVVALLVAWISQTFLQLVFLPILSVGQATLSRHAELQAEEAYQCTVKSFADIEEIKQLLQAQGKSAR